jgi:uncharacterized iron-regulated membrane protein
MTIWTRWVRQPQSLWLRKALFQVHLWTGIGVGLYLLMICVTGSVLVYRTEIMRAIATKPIIAVPSGTRLTDDQLKDAAKRVYPGFQVTDVFRARNKDQAVDIWLKRGTDSRKRMFDPYTGKDLGDSVPFGIWLMSSTIDLHDNLLGGPTGRLVNGVGAVFLVLLAMTGMIIWWPGIKKWRRSLILHGKVGWKRFNWDLHSALGIWSLAFVLLFGITGAYLAYPDPFSALADIIEPPTNANAGTRIVDSVTYWLAYAHFGRFARRIPGCLVRCDATLKAVWAAFGLAPAALFITGALMWWNRVLDPLRRAARDQKTVGRLPQIDRRRPAEVE